jgi:hypothetical protein
MRHHDGSELRELRLLRAELLEAHRELTRLRVQNEQLMASNRDLSTMVTASAKRSGELLKVIVAFRQLLEATDSASALRSLEEIMINIIGTEDFAVLTITDSRAMRPVAGMGLALSRAKSEPPTFDDLFVGTSKVIPMHIAEHVVGAIVIDELLPHREQLNGSDDQVLSLLSRFAATAVMAADHRRSWTQIRVAEVA